MACELLAVACGIQFPDQGLNPGPLHWEVRVLATGPPGTFAVVSFIVEKNSDPGKEIVSRWRWRWTEHVSWISEGGCRWLAKWPGTDQEVSRRSNKGEWPLTGRCESLREDVKLHLTHLFIPLFSLSLPDSNITTRKTGQFFYFVPCCFHRA